MKGFHFEKDLPHQKRAVESTVAIFENLPIVQPSGVNKNYINPVLNKTSNYKENITQVQTENQISHTKPNLKNSYSNILDIMMETGTGKTYTYTKTIFELNKRYGIFKFIIIVPTLSIKAGTVDFLKSETSREHFKEQYGKILNLHILESQKNSKSKKSYLPSAVVSFVNAGDFEKNRIQVLIINAGMINSDTMQKNFDKSLFDKYTNPFDALAVTQAFVIIDEPHRFGQGKKTWENIQKLKPQFILRYGATFLEYENLIYTLTAVEAFNRNLVKGVIGHIAEYKEGQNIIVEFIDSDGKEASFELQEKHRSKVIKLTKKESLSKIHEQMQGLEIENLNKSTVVLSNGLELKKGAKLNPYAYAQTLQEMMMRKAIQNHFELEKNLLTREVKIKPLTLFFIDNIDEYRNENGYLRKTLEEYVKQEVEKLLKTEKNSFYRAYLEKTLQNLSKTHGGYFSRDNVDTEESIEQEINEILHDKQAMLSLENPRRFIFSKWTLREGWDNPNVFQICKLRSSGSEISKLQEVGRGLRLPVNEYGNRVKEEQFYLHYFVDFTESNFVEKLVNEINEKSGTIRTEQTPERLTDEMLQLIKEKYNISDENALLQTLTLEKKVIDFSRKFINEGFHYIKANYPLIFVSVDSSKIRKATEEKKKLTVRTSKYDELKELWEKLNEKVILEYKFENELHFKNLFTEYLKEDEKNFHKGNINLTTTKLEVQGNKALANQTRTIDTNNTTNISTMKYSEFLKELANQIKLNMKTVHEAIINSKVNINPYLHTTTIRTIKQNFDHFLMKNAIDKFSIEYKKVSSKIHPTKLTDENGNVLQEISATDIGFLFSEEGVAHSYFFEELYYDSSLEKENIQTPIDSVIVFTKIPKNSIKIPVAGGLSYSPDFAYVLKFKDGEEKLYFIVECKNYPNDTGLSQEEIAKIKHAEKFFGGKIKIEFKTQFSNKKIFELIQEIISK